MMVMVQHQDKYTSSSNWMPTKRQETANKNDENGCNFHSYRYFNIHFYVQVSINYADMMMFDCVKHHRLPISEAKCMSRENDEFNNFT